MPVERSACSRNKLARACATGQRATRTAFSCRRPARGASTSKQRACARWKPKRKSWTHSLIWCACVGCASTHVHAHVAQQVGSAGSTTQQHGYAQVEDLKAAAASREEVAQAHVADAQRFSAESAEAMCAAEAAVADAANARARVSGRLARSSVSVRAGSCELMLGDCGCCCCAL